MERMATSRRFKTCPIPAIVVQPQAQVEHRYRHAITNCRMGQIKHEAGPDTGGLIGSRFVSPLNVGHKKAPKRVSAQ